MVMAQEWEKGAFPTLEFSIDGSSRVIRISLEKLVISREGRD